MRNESNVVVVIRNLYLVFCVLFLLALTGCKVGQDNSSSKSKPLMESFIECGSVSAGSTPVTVNLVNTYVSPVVVCSIQYNNNTIPVVTRVSNVTENSFDVRLQNPSNGTVEAEKVSYIVVEEGIHNINDVNIEAQKYLSTVTDNANSWVGETQSYKQSYTNPVVLGQGMSENNSNW